MKAASAICTLLPATTRSRTRSIRPVRDQHEIDSRSLGSDGQRAQVGRSDRAAIISGAGRLPVRIASNKSACADSPLPNANTTEPSSAALKLGSPGRPRALGASQGSPRRIPGLRIYDGRSINGGGSPREIGQYLDPVLANTESPRLGVVAVRCERRVADEVAHLGTLRQHCPRSRDGGAVVFHRPHLPHLQANAEGNLPTMRYRTS